jgi:hypothetical protein
MLYYVLYMFLDYWAEFRPYAPPPGLLGGSEVVPFAESVIFHRFCAVSRLGPVVQKHHNVCLRLRPYPPWFKGSLLQAIIPKSRTFG